MLPLLELDSVISNAYLEGRTRFGELGLELPVYSTRINAILKKHGREAKRIGFAVSDPEKKIRIPQRGLVGRHKTFAGERQAARKFG